MTFRARRVSFAGRKPVHAEAALKRENPHATHAAALVHCRSHPAAGLRGAAGAHRSAHCARRSSSCRCRSATRGSRRPSARAELLAELDGNDASIYRYGPTAGVAALREAIAQLVRRHGLDVDPVDEVLVGNGGTHALFCAARAVLDAGDEVLMASPYWPLAPGIFTFVRRSRRSRCRSRSACMPTTRSTPARSSPRRSARARRPSISSRRTTPTARCCRGTSSSASPRSRASTISGSSPTRSTRTWCSTASTCRSRRCPTCATAPSCCTRCRRAMRSPAVASGFASRRRRSSRRGGASRRTARSTSRSSCSARRSPRSRTKRSRAPPARPIAMRAIAR